MIKNLDDIAWFQEGPGVRNYQYTTNGTKLINVSNLGGINLNLSNTSRYISNEEANGKYRHFLCDVGDLVIASSGISEASISEKVSIVRNDDLPLCMNTSVIRFKPLNNDELSVKYLYYFFKSNSYKKQIIKLMTGIAQLNYGPSHLHRIKINYVEKTQQEQITNQLDLLSSLVETQKKQLALLDELIKSRFIETFGDPIINSKNFKTALIGDNCFVTKLAGFEYTNYIHYEETGDVIMVKAQNVKNGKLIEKEFSYISNEVSDSLPRSQLVAGDVVMTYVGANIGDVALIDNKHKYHLAPNVAKIRPNKNVYNSTFFMYMLMLLNEYVVGNSSDTAKAAIGMEKLRQLTVLVPPIESQDAFANFVVQVDKSKFIVQERLKLYQELLDKKMDEYFN